MRKHRVMTAAAVLVAGNRNRGEVTVSSAKQASPAGREPPVNVATMERRRLSDMVSQYGTLTYGAGSDGSPYTVINRARGTNTKLEGEPDSDLDPDSPRFQAADDSCKSLLPAMPPEDEQEAREEMLAYAQCMREHGFPSFPDPKPGEGIDLDAGEHPELDPSNPRFQAANEACGGPGEGDTNTQTNGGAP